MLKKLLYFLVGYFCLFSFAESKVFIDQEVSKFLNSKNTLNTDALKFLIVFKNKKQSSGANLGSLRLDQQKMEWQQQGLKNILKAKKTLGQKIKFNEAKKWKNLWIIGGVAVSLTQDQLNHLIELDSIQSVHWADRPYFLRIRNDFLGLYNSYNFTYGLNKIGVSEVRKKYPHLLGDGVRVGIIDSGIDATHPDLNGKLKLYKNFSPAKEAEPRDGFDHGTHVAGTVAGGDRSRKAIGVAPGADLIIARIFSSRGESTKLQIVESMQWMADPDGDVTTADHAQVVNSSWASNRSYSDLNPQDEPFCLAVSRWVRLGIIPVFAAGNTGPAAKSIAIPGACPGSFSVAATEGNDRLMNFSAVGPAEWKSLTLDKPEVSAPGFKIYSASSGGGYRKMSGTSMSAPHVAGAFALLLQAHPKVTADKIKTAMARGAKDLGQKGHDSDFGWGRIDIWKSLEYLDNN